MIYKPQTLLILTVWLLLSFLTVACSTKTVTIPSSAPTVTTLQPAIPSPTATLPPPIITINKPTPISASTSQQTATTPSHPLPEIPSDLLFIRDGRLELWKHETSLIETIVSDETAVVRNYVFSLATSRVLVYLTNDQLAHRTHTLKLLDLTTGQIANQLADIPCLIDYDLTADGEHIAYVVDDWLEDEQTCASGKRPHQGTIYANNWQLTEKKILGTCTDIIPDEWLLEFRREEFKALNGFIGCSSVAWLPNSQELLSLDAQGLWLYDLSHSEPRLVRQHPAFIPGEYEFFYTSGSYSLSGDHLLMLAILDGGRRSIIKVNSGNEVFPPNVRDKNFYPGNPWPIWQWIENERILKVTLSPLQANFNSVITIYEITDEPELQVVTSREIEMEGSTVLKAPYSLQDGSLSFVLSNNEEEYAHERGIYILKDFQDTPQKLADAPLLTNPPDRMQALWSSTETFVLLAHSTYDKQTIDFWLVDINQNKLHHLNPLIGDSITSPNWVP